MFWFVTQSLAVLQQPPSDPEGVLLPAAAPPEDHRCRVGASRREGRPGRFSATGLPVWKKGFHHLETVTLISSALHWHSSRFLVQPKMSHSQCTWSYNWGPFLCPGEAAVRQLQAVHRALPVPDEEHASGFPLHQRRCHYTLRAHAEVKSHCHHITSRTRPCCHTRNTLNQPFTPTDTETTARQPHSVEEAVSGSLLKQQYLNHFSLLISKDILNICSWPHILFYKS